MFFQRSLARRRHIRWMFNRWRVEMLSVVLFFPPEPQLKVKEGGSVLNVPPNAPCVDGVLTNGHLVLDNRPSYWHRRALQIARSLLDTVVVRHRLALCHSSIDGWVAHGFSRGGHESTEHSCSPPLKRWTTQLRRSIRSALPER